jgi:regulatory protein YycH of two-component signal transduction system YycFG
MKKTSLITIIIALSLLFISGCFLATPQSRQAYVNQNSGLSYQTKVDILNGIVRTGMTKEQVHASWGEPTHHPRRSVYSNGLVIEGWQYGRKEVVFRNGILSEIYE